MLGTGHVIESNAGKEREREREGGREGGRERERRERMLVCLVSVCVCVSQVCTHIVCTVVLVLWAKACLFIYILYAYLHYPACKQS